MLLKAVCDRCLLPVASNDAPVILLTYFMLWMLLLVWCAFVRTKKNCCFFFALHSIGNSLCGSLCKWFEKQCFCFQYKQTVKEILWLFSRIFGDWFHTASNRSVHVNVTGFAYIWSYCPLAFIVLTYTRWDWKIRWIFLFFRVPHKNVKVQNK